MMHIGMRGEGPPRGATTDGRQRKGAREAWADDDCDDYYMDGTGGNGSMAEGRESHGQTNKI